LILKEKNKGRVGVPETESREGHSRKGEKARKQGSDDNGFPTPEEPKWE